MRGLFVIMAAMLAGGLLAGGCSVIGCTENQNSLPLAGFYSSATGEAISVDSLAIGGVDAPDDSLLARPSQRLSQVYLPLRSTQTQTIFYIRYMQKALAELDAEDVIVFDYTSTPFFASEDCGAMYAYHITSLQYTRNLIDSVAVTVAESTITKVEQEYLRIYFRTSQPDDSVPDDTRARVITIPAHV